MNQEDLRTRLLIELEQVTRDALAATDGLSAEQLAWAEPRGWSIGQVLEHLIITTDRYCARIRGRIFSPNAPHVLAETPVDWEPSLIGWSIVKRLRSSRPLPTPRIYLPPESPRPDVVNLFVQRQKTLTYLLRASAALYWNRVRASSPVSALIRLNLGDAFNILVVHAQRHVGQMERVRDLLRVPREQARAS